jgi:hypothetical protein
VPDSLNEYSRFDSPVVHTRRLAQKLVRAAVFFAQPDKESQAAGALEDSEENGVEALALTPDATGPMMRRISKPTHCESRDAYAAQSSPINGSASCIARSDR